MTYMLKYIEESLKKISRGDFTDTSTEFPAMLQYQTNEHSDARMIQVLGRYSPDRDSTF